jgi:arginine-tRNA-protein transferase
MVGRQPCRIVARRRDTPQPIPRTRMKLFFSEFNSNYETYSFGYCVYCIKENQAEMPEIYAQGFLPFSGDAGEHAEVFFLVRSLRVNLERFGDTSENRRVARKIEGLGIRMTVCPKADVNTDDPAFREFCLGYTEKRFHGHPMPARQFAFMLRRDTLTHIIRFDIGDRPVGYVFAAIAGNTLHYWYAFFDASLMDEYPLGKWMMWRTISWAKENGLQYVYLGTCCTPRGLYKVRDHKGLEYFTGDGWSPDMDRLRQLCHEDEQRPFMETDGFRRGAATHREEP